MSRPRKPKPDPCTECGKIGTHCRGLCAACYTRWSRTKPEVQAKVKLYNDTRGKEIQARYRAKKNINKPPKPLKLICDCGKPVRSKGLCVNCYQKHYYRQRHGEPLNPPVRHNYEEMFKKVLAQVKFGLTISKACERSKVDRTNFYKNLTPVQKRELKECRAIGIMKDEDDF